MACVLSGLQALYGAGEMELLCLQTALCEYFGNSSKRHGVLLSMSLVQNCLLAHEPNMFLGTGQHCILAGLEFWSQLLRHASQSCSDP